MKKQDKIFQGRTGWWVLTALLAFTMIGAWAVPARKGLWRTVTLTDGTQVKVQLVGDEHLHFYQSADGTRYQQVDSTDTWQAVADSALTRLQTFAAKRRQLSAAHSTLARQHAAQKAKGKASSSGSSVFQGTQRGLIILVEFPDNKFASGHDVTLYNDIANAENYSNGNFLGSVHDYFKAQSYGQFDLQFDVVGICTLSNKMAYYGGNDRNGEDLRPGAMVAEACQWADEQGVDFSKYDWDGDGEVEEVFILYAGKGENSGGAANTVWPHKWELSASDYKESLTFDNTKIDVYACSNELEYDGSITGIGTICHEFSHCMGFPDLYDTSESGSNFGMDAFDLMDYGNYNGDTFCPAGYSAYERAACGWIDLKDVTDMDSALTVSSLQPLSSEGDAYVIYNKGNENECYIVENRQLEGWDADLPGKGLMVTHVDYDDSVWYYNVPNTNYGQYYDANGESCYNTHQRLTIFHADNTASSSNTATDLYPFRNNDSLTVNSKPAATLYNENSDGTKYMHVGIHDIKQNADGTMSLTFRGKDYSGGGTSSVRRVVAASPADGGQLVDIYSISGVLVARQTTLSEAQAFLSRGIYIAGGKKLVVE